MDRMSLKESGPTRCRACDALDDLVTAYLLADSLDAAEGVAREWVGHQPQSGRAWNALGLALEARGRYAEALEARRRLAMLQPGSVLGAVAPARVLLRMGDFAAADRMLLDRIASGPQDIQRRALWFLIISLRMQGRLQEALARSQQYRRLVTGDQSSSGGPSYDLLLLGQALFESGQPHAAAALFDSVGRASGDPNSRGRSARRLAWALTHVATSRAASGDTVGLAALADTIEMLGLESGYGRDQRLHHHVRGLLELARGRPAEGMAEFRRAVFSLNTGYVRTNYELARALMQLGLGQEAIQVLRPAVHGSLESGNLYLTWTELHAWLGRAFEAVGERDSALAHYRWALGAWRNADRTLWAHRDSVEARFAALTKPTP
jgi:tetratricopeptide (TPR) repeat protein